MQRPLKIAVYSGEIPSTTFIERLIAELAKSGCHVLLFGRLNKKVKDLNNITVLGFRSNTFLKGLFLLRYTILLTLFRYHEKKQLDSILKKTAKTTRHDKVKCYPVLWHKPHVFHVQWAKGIHEWMWVKQFGIKLVVSLRGAHINYSPIADPLLAEMYRETFPKVDGFHAVSKAIGIEAQNYGAQARNIFVAYSGLNVAQKNTVQPVKHLISSRLHIISVGRPHWKKGYTYALDACKLLKDKGLNFSYTIVGAANTTEYQYHCKDLGIQDCVTLLSKQTFSEVQALMKQADVLLLPSVEEGIANVVLEAMAQETLVVSTNCGGMNEVITHGMNGFLVPIRDSNAIAKQLLNVYDLKPVKQQQIKMAALKTIKEQHQSTSMASEMLKFYKHVLKNEVI
ncbi:glycosyltransferase family 4 protein [Corallibacter sp.]|uniref:glycosyltransferase family 4 protein n=1 Tax=Corallibacter sp. TaxID=2038084 RepID=UPI003AB66035